MSASLANVFGVAVAFRHFDVAVATEKTGHGVADASRAPILLKERRAATAAIETFLNLAEHSVVHHVAEKLAGQPRQEATKKNRSARGFRREPTQYVCFHGFPLGAPPPPRVRERKEPASSSSHLESDRTALLLSVESHASRRSRCPNRSQPAADWPGEATTENECPVDQDDSLIDGARLYSIGRG